MYVYYERERHINVYIYIYIIYYVLLVNRIGSGDPRHELARALDLRPLFLGRLSGGTTCPTHFCICMCLALLIYVFC